MTDTTAPPDQAHTPTKIRITATEAQLRSLQAGMAAARKAGQQDGDFEAADALLTSLLAMDRPTIIGGVSFRPASIGARHMAQKVKRAVEAAKKDAPSEEFDGMDVALAFALVQHDYRLVGEIFTQKGHSPKASLTAVFDKARETFADFGFDDLQKMEAFLEAEWKSWEGPTTAESTTAATTPPDSAPPAGEAASKP